MTTDNEVLAARLLISVDVFRGVERTINTPDAYELGGEYLVIRNAECDNAEAFYPRGIFNVAEEGLFEYPDPDDLMIKAVSEGLSTLSNHTESEFSYAGRIEEMNHV